MKRVLLAVGAAVVVFVAVAAPTGVLGMLDPGYCFDHPDRPPEASSHEESLSLVPPGPVCDYGSVRIGPGWWPAVSAGAAVVAALVVLRTRR